MAKTIWPDEIISRIAMTFSLNAERNTIAETNRHFRDNISIDRAMRAGAMMQGAMVRYPLTKFPPVTSMDQKIREVVPPIWILATVMSNHIAGQDRRQYASRHVGDRYIALEDSLTPNHYMPNPILNAAMNTPHYRRVQSEGLFYVQYTYSPDIMLKQYFQRITNKVHRHDPIDVTRSWDTTATQTAPELLRATFTGDELGIYGW